MVDKFISAHNKVMVANQEVEIRRYINPATRLIISHVCPSIPDEIILENLKQLNLQLISPITELKAGFERAEYKHILGNRRQVFLPPNYDKQVPNSIEIVYEETKYRIFLSLDVNCYICKKRGHTGTYCPNKTNNDTQNLQPITATQNSHTEIQTEIIVKEKETLNITNPPEQQTQTEVTNETINKITHTQTKEINENPEDNLTASTAAKNKRQAQSISSWEDEIEIESENEVTPQQTSTPKGKNKKKPKKQRAESPENITTTTTTTQQTKQNITAIPKKTLEIIKREIESNSSMYILKYDEMIEFMTKSQTTTEHLKLAKAYTKDIPTLLMNLDDLHSVIEDSAVRNKTTRLKNKIKDQLKKDIEETKSNTTTTESNNNKENK